MPPLPFYSIGKQGLVKDIAAHELPPLAWSDGGNILFRDGKIVRRAGHEEVLGTPLSTPYWLMFAFTPVNAFWMYSSLTKMYATDGATHVDITRTVGGNYGTQEKLLWHGGMITGIPVITNNVDVPQMWNPVNLSTALANLTAWPATDRARVIKPFKNFLIAMNITRSSVNFPHMVKWSHPAVPGSVPSTWDVADPTKLAGEVEIGDQLPGIIEDAYSLRDMLVIYKTNSVWGMQYIGGNSVFRFFPILSYSGILSAHCIAEIKEGRAHIIATADDFIVFDGQNTQSVLDERYKKFIEDNLEPESSDRSFVFTIPKMKEAWFCFPEIGETWPTLALIWNWQENTITVRDLPANFTFATIGALTGVGDNWDADSGTWDSDSEFWDVVQFRANFFEIVGSTFTPNKLLGLERTQQFNGVDYTSYVQRTGLAVTGRDRVTGEFKSDISVRKLVTRIWLKAHGSPFQVRLGGQEDVDASVVWDAWQTFTPGSAIRYLDFTVNTPLIAIEFSSSVGGEWTVDGYDLELVPLGSL
jgi:hypothetical protein